MTTSFDEALARARDGSSTHDEARALVAAMSVDEKLECLDGDLNAWAGLMAMMSGSYHERTFPAAAVPRLGIPGIKFSDGPRGCVIGRKTAFPVSMARGASWDVDLEQRIGEAIGAELRTVGADFYGGVCVNLLRHPGWGRAQETYGEEPHHVGELGRALMVGAQRHVMACVKHFAVNSMENSRFKVDVRADERALHEVYLPHFRRIVESGVTGVMSAYNSLNGTYCGDNSELLTGILRDEWGFQGIVVSDFIFGLRDPVRSVLAGLDIEMPFRQLRRLHLPDAVADGRLPIEAVDAAAVRIVDTQIRYHIDERPPVDPHVVAGPSHRALAREAAEKSIVLLRNDGILPLHRSWLRRVAVIGRLAAVRNLGDHGSSDVLVSDAITPLDGLRLALPEAIVDFSERDVAVAHGADVAIVVVGCTWADEGEFIDASGTVGLAGQLLPPMTEADRDEIAALPARPATDETSPPTVDASGFAPGGDRRSLRLSSDDEALIRSTVAVNQRTVVVLMGGSAIVMEDWRHEVPAIVMLWYPGMEGGHALAGVLLGDVNPSGRLPFSIPTDEAHLPHWDPDADTERYDLWHGHWKLTRDGHVPAFAFGFGLSYTTFELTALAVDGDRARVEVRNTGNRAGDAVVQWYGGMIASRYQRPSERLIGFARVHVPAGESVSAEVALDFRQLDVRDHGAWVTEEGCYRVTAAQFAGDPRAVSVQVERSP